jgi:phosphoribosyl 1,2-cyclic phosphate phosphodiesterase
MALFRRQDMQVLFLGTGTSYGVPMVACDCAVCRSEDPRNRRTRPSVLLRERGATLLIDASTDLRQQMLRHAVQRLDAVLLTHSHADHVLGLDDLRAFSGRQNAPLPVYANAETLQVVQRNFEYAFTEASNPARWEVPRLRAFEMDGGAEVCGVPVTAVPIWHGRRAILGYRIGGLAYLTDCSAVPEESFRLLGELDMLVVGAVRLDPHPAHFNLAGALALVEKVKPRRAYFTHISHRLDHAVIEAGLPPNVRLAYDGLEVEAPGS